MVRAASANTEKNQMINDNLVFPPNSTWTYLDNHELQSLEHKGYNIYFGKASINWTEKQGFFVRLKYKNKILFSVHATQESPEFVELQNIFEENNTDNLSNELLRFYVKHTSYRRLPDFISSLFETAFISGKLQAKREIRDTLGISDSTEV